MRKKISGGTVETEIYTTEGGYVAITQPAPSDSQQVCLLSADQLPELIRELTDALRRPADVGGSCRGIARSQSRGSRQRE